MGEPAKISQSEPDGMRGTLRLAAYSILATDAAAVALLAGGKALGLTLNLPLLTGMVAGLAGCAAFLLLAVGKQGEVSERDRHLMAETMNDAATGRAICGPGGEALYVNTTFIRQLGPLPEGTNLANPEQVLEQCFARDTLHIPDFSRIRQQAHQGQFGACELLIKGEDGASHFYLVEAWPSKAYPRHVTWRVEDITPRVQVREAIQQEQARWADFMDHAPVGFFSIDETGRFIFANATLARWLGLSSREIIAQGLRLHDVMVRPPQDVQPYDVGGDGGTFQQGEFTLKGPGGRQFQALIAQTVEPSARDGAVLTRAVVHDLTPEREWQTALQESQARFRRFFEESPIGVALVAEGGALAECNQAFLRMLGSDAAQIIAQPLGSFVESSQADLAQCLARVASGEPASKPLEVRLKGSGGREITAQLYIRRLEADDVTGARLILHFIDMTDQKNLEARFSQSQKMQAIGQLAGGVAHDFNNLLTAMIGFCDLLLLRHKPGDPSFADIMQIKQNANRAAGLVRQLLAFSRQQTLQPRVLSLTDALVDLSNLLRRLIGENIELRLVHGRDLGLVKVDQGQFEQVIINMAVNARDAMPISGGKLTVTTSNLTLTAPMRREHDEVPPGDWVVIEIADTGTGIPPDIVGRIFDPFFSTKEVGKGTGLGLSTCYGIVKQTGGHIFVDSEIGRGTRFSIYLPRYVRTADEQAEVQREVAAEKVAPDLTGAGVILLVEDEDAVRMFAARALKNKGYTVVEARSGDHALEVLKTHTGQIDLVVSDVMMPGTDGPTMMQEIKRQRPGIKAIFISGYSEERLKESFESGEAVFFLPKPFSLKQLAEKVKEVLQEG